MEKSIAISLEIDDKGSVVVKKFSADTVKKVQKMSDKSIGHVKRLSAKFTKGLGGAVSGVGRALTSLKALAVGVLAGWGITQVLGEFGTFESALADMGKVTEESFESIKNKIMELPPSLGSATELTRGYYQVISAGVEGAANQLDTLTTASKLAKTAHADQAEVITGLSSIMDSFKVESMGAAEAMQVMEKTGKTTVAGLIPVIGELSSGSAALGIGLNEMSAAFAAVTLSSGGTEKAATQYKALLTSLLAPTQGMTDLLAKYGGAQNAIKEIGFGGVLKLIKDETGGNATATKKLVGSVEAYLGFLSASADNMSTYNSNLKEQKNKTGAVDKAWKDYMNTLNAIRDTFKNIIGKQVILIGEKLAPAVKKIIKVTGKWLDKNREFITLKFESWINGALEGIANFIEAAAGTVESLYGLKSAVHESISFLAAMGAALTDVAAALLLLDPVNAYKAAVHGFRDTFPVLAEMRDKFDALGVSQANSAQEAANSQAKFAGYADKMRTVADDVRNLTTTQDDTATSSKTMEDAFSSAAGASEKSAQGMVTIWEEASVKIDGEWTKTKMAFEVPAVIAIEDQASIPMKEIKTQAEAMQDKVAQTITVSVTDQATPALKRIQAEIAKIKDKTVTITTKTKFTGEGSSELPLSEKVAEMDALVQDYAKNVNDTTAQSNIEFTGTGAGAGEMSASDAIWAIEDAWGLGAVRISEIIPIITVNNTAALNAIDQVSAAYEEHVLSVLRFQAELTTPKFMGGRSTYAQGIQDQLDYARRLLEEEARLITEYYDRHPMFTPADSYAEGTDYVPRTGLYQLHQGEIVIPAAESNMIRSSSNSKTVKTTNTKIGDVHIHIPAQATQQNTQDWRAITRDVIIPELKRAAY